MTNSGRSRHEKKWCEFKDEGLEKEGAAAEGIALGNACRFCAQILSNYRNARRHEDLRCKLRDRACQFCHKVYSSKWHMKRHQEYRCRVKKEAAATATAESKLEARASVPRSDGIESPHRGDEDALGEEQEEVEEKEREREERRGRACKFCHKLYASKWGVKRHQRLRCRAAAAAASTESTHGERIFSAKLKARA